MERISKTGILQAMDRVKIVGLTSEKGKDLNGRIGTVRSAHDIENDGTYNHYEAQLPDGRYRVQVEYQETAGREVRPGVLKPQATTKIFSLRRENLVLEDFGLGTIGRDPEGLAILRRHGVDIGSTAESDARDPETAGFFPAILQGDAVRAREILDVLKSRGSPNPGECILDATGDGPLTGAIQHGHIDIVRLLLEYGADPNRRCSMPIMRDANVTYFNLAMILFDKIDNAEEIVNALIDGGAEVNTMCHKGTPLSSATKIMNDHATRMRVCRKLLARGADPNQYIEIAESGLVRNQALVLPGTCCSELGKYSEEDQLELVQLLLDHGADPGRYVKLEARGEECNAIHVMVSHRKSRALELLLSSEKGRAAVNSKRIERCRHPRENNGNGETALTMCVAQHNLEQYKENRHMAVQLLKAGADPDIEDHLGISATMWLKDRNPDKKFPHAKKKELHDLVKKASRIVPTFWDSEEVQRFIDEGERGIAKCDNCGTWANQEFHDGKTRLNFQRCSRCKKVFCEWLCIIHVQTKICSCAHLVSSPMPHLIFSERLL